MQSSVGEIVLRVAEVRREPTRPSETTALAERNRRREIGRQGDFELPVEIVADIEEHDIDEPFAGAAIRQETFVAAHVFDENPQAELVLHAERRFADEAVLAKPAVARAHEGALGRIEFEPRPDTLFDLDPDAEDALQNTSQSRCGARLRAEQAGKTGA